MPGASCLHCGVRIAPLSLSYTSGGASAGCLAASALMKKIVKEVHSGWTTSGMGLVQTDSAREKEVCECTDNRIKVSKVGKLQSRRNYNLSLCTGKCLHKVNVSASSLTAN